MEHNIVAVLYVDRNGENVIKGVFSTWEKAQWYADEYLHEWYCIESFTLNEGVEDGGLI